MLGLDGGMTVILILCLLIACFFEFINGFHDTANAVATVIYTNSMKPSQAVVLSGISNFIGVFVGISVAMGVVNLLPIALLIDPSISHSIAMIMALLLTAIFWNLGTWYMGIPCSSSHTLFGSIFGVGIAYGLISESGTIALNWAKVEDVSLALLISPVVGFGLTLGLVTFLKKKVKSKKLFAEPEKKKSPPFWTRLTLIATCTMVSIFHGSNDGQKGIGLLMIILISLVPAHFALNHLKDPINLSISVNKIETAIDHINIKQLSTQQKLSMSIIKEKADTMRSILTGVTTFSKLKYSDHFELRKDILVLANESKTLLSGQIYEAGAVIPDIYKGELKKGIKEIKSFTEYAPWWVVLLISISLGLGTMIGWKRIVVTVGEKIGKERLNYAQGASANFITATTIGLATWLGLPVSTTHVLSSGVAGSMVATHGLKNLRAKTVKNILIAWLVTIPVTIIISGGLFLLFRIIF